MQSSEPEPELCLIINQGGHGKAKQGTDSWNFTVVLNFLKLYQATTKGSLGQSFDQFLDQKARQNFRLYFGLNIDPNLLKNLGQNSWLYFGIKLETFIRACFWSYVEHLFIGFFLLVDRYRGFGKKIPTEKIHWNPVSYIFR